MANKEYSSDLDLKEFEILLYKYKPNKVINGATIKISLFTNLLCIEIQFYIFSNIKYI